MWIEEGSHRTSSTEILLASMRRITVVLEFRSPLTACGITASVDGVDGINQGVAIPSITIQRAWHRIGNRIRKAIQPVPNAYEDEAQTICGRKTYGDKSDGFYRLGPAARDVYSNSAQPKYVYLLCVRARNT